MLNGSTPFASLLYCILIRTVWPTERKRADPYQPGLVSWCAIHADRGSVLFAGSLTRNPITAVFCLTLTLLLAGCSGSKSSDMGSYSGAVYTVKRGDTLYRISRTTGTSVKDLARLNGISPPYTIEVGQKLKVNGSSSSGKKSF